MIKNEETTDEVVEIIEQKDTRARFFIITAAATGVIVGGLLGTIYAQNKWQAVIEHYQEQTHVLNQEYQSLIESVKVEKKQAQASLFEFQQQAKQQAEQESKEHVVQLGKQAIELEKANDTLVSRVSMLEQQLEEKQLQTEKLESRLSLQVSLFERARELFQKEEQIKQQLVALNEQQDQLRPQLDKLADECNLFLEGKSWDAKSDVCSRHDEVSSQVAQNDQLIAIYKLDLKEIEALSDELGLN